MKNQRNHAQHHLGLILALAALMSATMLVLGPARLASAQAVYPSWSYTGRLNTGRVLHTMTLLPNGKVLVAGGYNCYPCVELNSAELYDPATGMWGYTGNLNSPRINHTATLLPNGKVLVTGGFRNVFDRNSLNSAELYDPATGKWSSTGSLNTVRDGHTATLLPNGKVLVAGGGYYANMVINPSNSAELYDPTTGTWSYTRNLNAARWAHTATLLLNGKVLVAAGFLFYSESAELFDPATETWSYTGKPNSAHYAHTATLLPNGKVLIEGGQGSSNIAELYEPDTGTWSSTGNLNYSHEFQKCHAPAQWQGACRGRFRCPQ